jgi:dolichol kinase
MKRLTVPRGKLNIKKIREIRDRLPHPEKSLKEWVVFFVPVYVAIAALFVGYALGIIETFAFVAFLAYGLAALAIGIVLQEIRPNFFHYIGRNIYHSLGGVMLVIGGMFVLYFNSLLLVLFCVFLMFLVGRILELAGIETLFSHSHTLKHVADFKKSTHYEAGSYWLFSCLIVLLIFEANIAYASILILAIGDTAASFVGRKMGRWKNPLNPKKTVEGNLAFFATSLFAAMLFVPTQTAIVVAFVAAVVESLPIRINDNLTVPLSAGVTMYLLSML